MFGKPSATRRAALALIVLGAVAPELAAQTPPANYDEAKVGTYPPLDPLTTSDGRKVTTAAMWTQVRRPELFRLFATEMYGKVPRKPGALAGVRVRSHADGTIEPLPARGEGQAPVPFYSAMPRIGQPEARIISTDDHALGDTAVRREVSVALTQHPDGPRMNLLIYVPKSASASHRVPAFVGLNFGGNHTISADPGIALAQVWTHPSPTRKAAVHPADPATRGKASSRWPVERIIARGYALATAYYEDIDPDFDDGFQNGIHPYFYAEGQTRPADDEWGSIAAWAWGLSRALDVLQSVNEIDPGKVAVMGHSRLGKTALWAGATDPRFALVISNNSGCGGAALSRRIYGETIGRMNTAFPHWLCTNFRKYSEHEERLPFDQHELIALIAPRPVLVSSAEEDQWADPKGEFLGAQGADPVYRLLGTDGLGITEMPPPARDSLVKSTIGYRYRPGKHDVTVDDWDAYMRFADHHLHRGGR